MKTIRERIFDQLQKNFEAVQKGVNDHPLTWNTVTQKPPEDVEQITGNFVALLQGTELNTDEVRTVRKELEFLTEFWIRLQLGDVRATLVCQVMASVTRTIRQNLPLIEEGTNTQLAIDIVEVRNETEIELDDLVGGVIVWTIRYRHAQDDPRLFIS